MSIPKEPRQLMINIMYLVLTAMLALNVSAEIFNAFKLVDKGLQKSNSVLDSSNEGVPGQIQTLAKKKPELKIYGEKAPQVRALSKEFVEYVDGIWTSMAEYYPLDDPKYPGELKNKKNKDIATRMLVTEGMGEELKAKILEYKGKFLNLVDEKDRAGFASKIAMEIDDQSWQNAKGKVNWSDYNFRQMPVGALMPMFTKFKNDAKSTEAAILNYYLEKVGGEDIVLDKFQVVSSPDKTYVIQGEQFKTDVFLSASASQSSSTGVSISVNGRKLPVKEGVATYTEGANGTGIKKYNASISVTNPVTNETKTYKKAFEYEVGLRSVSVSADKMNVFYIGVENPVSVSAAGVPTNSLKVNGSGITLKPNGKGKFVATASKPGQANVTVSGEGLKATKFPFRIKRIPDPVARLSKNSGGTMGNGEFKAQGGVGAFLDNFDFDAKCKIQGYILTKLAPRQDPIESNNAGARYNDKSGRLVKSAKPGDTYYFDNVKAKCPGDSAGRKINSMVFKIK